MRILLFDIDGVLVNPYGYRKAYFETCKWLVDKGNLNINLPADDIPALFESHGVTSEWDMLSITAGIMINRVIKANQINLDSDQLELVLYELSPIVKEPVEINFRNHIESLSDTFHLHEIPSVGVLQAGAKILSSLSSELREDIFKNTRSAEKTLVTRVFQNFVLGTETFEKTYHLKAVVDCDSYLRSFDQPLLSEQMKKKLINKIETENMLIAALTARPSLQPRNAELDNVEYSPEAEFALEVIHMPDMPLIGYGRLQYIEQFIGISADLLIKPDGFHALAALFSLLGKSELLGLKTAGEVRKSNVLPEWMQENNSDSITICVFEDSQGGIRSVISAADQLNELGINTDIRLYGVTQNTDKEKTLKKLDAMVFPDINAALNYELSL